MPLPGAFPSPSITLPIKRVHTFLPLFGSFSSSCCQKQLLLSRHNNATKITANSAAVQPRRSLVYQRAFAFDKAATEATRLHQGYLLCCNRCTSLSRVAFSAALTAIEGFAFRGCSAITAITLPDATTTIGQFAFRGCRSLKKLTLSAALVTIGCGSFRGCSSLAEVTLPATLKTIEDDAFYECILLTKPVLPALTTVGDGAWELTRPAAIIRPSALLLAGCSEMT